MAVMTQDSPTVATEEGRRIPVREGHPAERRMVEFDWSTTPLHWVPDDPFSTHQINVLHLLLPAGERWFLDVVNKARPLVDDEELRATIKPFVQQESWHAYAHSVVLEHLAANGIDTKAYTDKLDLWFKRVLGDHPSWPAPMQRWWLNRRLAVVAALEHVTCILGKWILENDGLERAGADPMMLDLLRWHGAEEVEHRSLVFDVHANVSGSHTQRVTTMLEVSVMLSLWWIAGIRYLMRHDPTLHGVKPRWRDWLRASRQQRVPGPRLLYGSVPRYLRRHHHPRTEASTAMALAYLERSPAARAARASSAQHTTDG